MANTFTDAVAASAAGVEPVLIAEMQEHLRVDSDDENDLIEALITTARVTLEHWTRRQFITATKNLYLAAFTAEIRVPYPPLQSVAAITYTDTGGAEQTLASSVYTVDTNHDPGRIVEAYSQNWPATRAIINAVNIEYVAGYGSAGTDVPEPLRSAMKLLVATWFENRESVVIGTIVSVLPQAVDALIFPYRIWNF